MTIAQAWPPRRSRRSPHGLRKISSETGSLTLAPDGYSSDVDQVVQRKWTNHDVGIGRRYCVGIDVIGNFLSLINNIAVHG